MAITKSTRNARPVTANTSITSGVRNRQAAPVMAGFDALTPAQRTFARQIQSNISRSARITAATNTTNIMARPDFLELLPMFVQKLHVLDVFGSVAMRSRQQLIPYFKFIAENTKGETLAGDILSSPFVNRQGIDPNFGGRLVKNETCFEEGDASARCAYTPVLPNSVSVVVTDAEGIAATYVDDGNGGLVLNGAIKGNINYSTGEILGLEGAKMVATYQYDNENVGPHYDGADHHGHYGAQMGKGYLQLDEINLVAEAHELACYWSIYAAFAAQQEYGANIADIAKEAAFSELTAEINSLCFGKLRDAAKATPAFDWDASPVLAGSVVPSDYLNMFKLKLEQASSSIYQRTRLSRPNRLVMGTTAGAYVKMINGFQAENGTDDVGPYKLGQLGEFVCYVDPNYQPNEWVMCCKNNDIRRNSALFGEYMPLSATDPIGLANASVQQGYATMFAAEVVNPGTVARGKIIGAQF